MGRGQEEDMSLAAVDRSTDGRGMLGTSSLENGKHDGLGPEDEIFFYIWV